MTASMALPWRGAFGRVLLVAASRSITGARNRLENTKSTVKRREQVATQVASASQFRQREKSRCGRPRFNRVLDPL